MAMNYGYGKSKIGKVAYDVYIKVNESASAWGDTATWQKVGICAEKPQITVPAGDTYKVNTGDEPIVSANINFEAVVAEVTSANYNALRGLVNKDVSVAFAIAGASAPTGDTAPVKGIIAKNITIYPELMFVSNDQNTIKLTGKREISPTDVNSVVLGAEA